MQCKRVLFTKSFKTHLRSDRDGRDEAWKYMQQQRKYLLDTVFKAFQPPETEEAEQSEPDDDEQFRKTHNV